MAPAPKRRKILQSLYLDQAATDALDRLAKQSGTPKAVLLREAVDDLLEKRRIEWTRERATNPTRTVHRAKLVKPARDKK